MRTATIIILGVIAGLASLVSGCFPQPSTDELYERTHFTYTVIEVPEEVEMRGEYDEDNVAADQADSEVAQELGEANARALRSCVVSPASNSAHRASSTIQPGQTDQPGQAGAEAQCALRPRSTSSRLER